MGTAVYSFKFPGNERLFPTWMGDHWLGKRVQFTLCGVKMTGEVIATQKVYLCNGVHDILTIEIEGERKQTKLQLHRQACKLIQQP